MAFAIDSRRSVAAILAIACSAVLFWFGNGLNPWWPLMWFAPLPVLIFATRGSWWGSAIVSWLSLLLGSLTMWHYFHRIHAPWFQTYAVVGLVFALAVLLFRALLRRGTYWSSLLAFPALWVTCAYIANLTTSSGTGGSLAYTQLKFLPFLQLASVTGPWGMTFLLLLFPAAIAISLHLRRSAPTNAACIAGTSFGIIVLALIFGAIRLAIPASHQQVKVGLIASDLPANDGVMNSGAPTERLFRDYAGQAATLAAQGAQVIVMPEKLGVLTPSDSAAADAIFQNVANETGATLVAGMVTVAPPLKYNQARVYTPQASMLLYDKHHMLPPFESSFTPGRNLTLVSSKRTPWGVAICKDMDFTSLSRKYGNAGIGLMLVPGWDFRVDRAWHGHMAIMRGVEDGFSIAHSAKDGYLTVSDSRGRILAQTRSTSAPFATLNANVPTAYVQTVYLWLGDWFAWLAMAIFLFTLIQLFRIHRKLQRPSNIPDSQTKEMV